MKKKKITKESFESLRGSFPVLTLDELFHCIGRNGCLIHCFAYITGTSYEWWLDEANCYGYLTSGGISHENYSAAAAIGGLYVEDVQGTAVSFNPGTGKTSNGETLMVTFVPPNGNSDVDHAVIVTSINSDASYIEYYDPSNGSNGVITNNDFTGLYVVGSNLT